MKVRYREGYKYQLAEAYFVETDILPWQMINTRWIVLDGSGGLWIMSDYAWDGPSGPTIDTKDSIRASLVHDALYQLMREGHLDPQIYRKPADSLFYRLCLEDGMNPIRAAAWYEGLRLGAAGAAAPRSEKPILEAPQNG